MKLLPVFLVVAVSLGLSLRLVAQEPGIVPDSGKAEPEATKTDAPKPDETQEAQDKEKPRQGAGGLPEVDVAIKTPEAKKAQEEFLKLPAEKQQQFAKLMQEGQTLLGQKRVQEALEKFNEAETLWPLHPNVINLKGAALVNLRDFERAAKYFEKGAVLYPDFWQMRFNLAEMHFVQGNYKKGEEMFQQLLAHEKAIEGPTRRLVDYKVILCVLKQGRADDAKKMIDKYDIYDDTPVHYYGLAAWYFAKGDKAKGEEWVANARRVYSQQTNSIFEDALTELGWLFVF